MTHPHDDTSTAAGRPEGLMKDPAEMQTGGRVSLERALEVVAALDHFARSKPELLRRLRRASLDSAMVAADPKELVELNVAGLCTEKGSVLVDVAPIVRAAVRGAEGRESVENPFLDERNRAILDHLRNGVTVSLYCDASEIKAMHENETVADLAEAPLRAKWVGYVEKRPGNPPGTAPSRN